jgi:hypothetical protein
MSKIIVPMIDTSSYDVFNMVVCYYKVNMSECLFWLKSNHKWQHEIHNCKNVQTSIWSFVQIGFGSRLDWNHAIDLF